MEGRDFNKTFSRVTKKTALRPILAGANRYVWIVCQMDVCMAFLDGELEEDTT